jgi:hypothetical protein
MRKVIYLCILLGFNHLSAQDFKARWHYQVHEDLYGGSLACPDPEKGVFAGFGNMSKLEIDGSQWQTVSKQRAVLASFDSSGRCLWQKPILSDAYIEPLVCRMVRNGLYLASISNNHKKPWVLDGDTFYGSAVAGMNYQGDIDFIKSMPGIVTSSPIPSPNNKYLVKCNVRTHDTVDGTIYSKGFWVIEVDGSGVIHREIKLGESGNDFSYSAVAGNDSMIVFTGEAYIDKPFIGNGWQVRAIDSIPRWGVAYGRDIFIACVNNQGQLKWMYRIDTMSKGTSPRSMVLLANGKIIWMPTYYKTGEFLGKKTRVRLNDGRFPIYCEINSEDGTVNTIRMTNELFGGEDNDVKLFTDDKFSTVMVASLGGESTRTALGLTSDQWKASFTKLMYFDSNMNFLSQASIPGFERMVVNAHNINHVVDYLYFPYGSKDSTMMLDGVAYKNELGGDFILSNYTTEKFNMSASNNKVYGGNLSIFPNPAGQEFMLLNNQHNWKSASVFDAHGRNSGMLQAENGKWNIGHLSPGMYMLQFEGDAGTHAWSRLLISR